MNYIDIIFTILLVWAAYKGYNKGLLIELAKLVALVLGVFGAIHFSEYLKPIIVEKFNISPQLSSIISFILIFIVVVIIVFILAKLVEKTVKALALGIFNSLGGALFSILQYGFIISVIILIFGFIHLDKFIFPEKSREKSYLFIPVSNFAPTVIPKIKAMKIEEQVEKVDKKIDENKNVINEKIKKNHNK